MNTPQRTESEFKPAELPSGIREIDGKPHMIDAKGGFMPMNMVQAQDQLEDEVVRKIVGYMLAASEQIGRLKQHILRDVDEFSELLEAEYEATVGGKKGNKTLRSYNGLFKVEVRINDFVDFGPSLQTAKGLVDECLVEWAEDAHDNIRAIITNAFHTDNAGQVNRTELIKLTKLPIEDKRWKNAMRAISDAQRVVGSKLYVRAYRRKDQAAAWEPISLDIAKV